MRLISYSMGRPRRGAGSSGRRPSPREPAPDAADGVVEIVHHALLQRDDGVVRDVDRLGADLRTALGDVAVADPGLLLEVSRAGGHVEGVHLEARDPDEEARPREAVLLLVVAQHVADVLAEEALDALAELLHPVDVGLLDAPRSVRLVGWTRSEGRDAFVHLVVPRDVADQVLDDRKRLHGRDGDRLARRELVHARHAEEPRLAVHLGTAGPAPPRLAVPAARQVARLVRLHLVNRVEHDHPLVERYRVVREGAARPITAKDTEHRIHGLHTSPSTMRRSSAGSSGSGSWVTVMAPFCRRTMTFTVPKCLSESGYSTRVCAPRLSRRSSAARVIASLTVSRQWRSSATCQPGLNWRLPAAPARAARARSLSSSARAVRRSSSVRAMPT